MLTGRKQLNGSQRQGGIRGPLRQHHQRHGWPLVKQLRRMGKADWNPLRLWASLSLALLLAACGSENPSASPSPSIKQVSEAEARALYIRKCSLCHGDDGKLMASKSPDLSKSTITMAERVALITYGKGTMPAQKSVLSKSEIEAVALYIERFRN
jgi:mono/diheme cytochrome c family protein